MIDKLYYYSEESGRRFYAIMLVSIAILKLHSKNILFVLDYRLNMYSFFRNLN